MTILPDEVEKYGLKYAEDEHYDLVSGRDSVGAREAGLPGCNVWARHPSRTLTPSRSHTRMQPSHAPPLPTPSRMAWQTGVTVDIKDLNDDPQDSNRIVWLLLDAMNVTVHTVFIWLITAPTLLACIQFQVSGGDAAKGLGLRA